MSEYASEVWGYGENVSCEGIQQRASRFYLGVHPKTSTLALIGYIGWSTAQLKRHRNIMRYWNRLIQMDDTRLTKQIFLYDVNKCFGNRSSEVKSILNATGLEMIFDNLMVCNYKDIYQKCIDNYAERWKLGVALKPKLRTYVLFKEALGTEDYIKLCSSRRKRSLLAQFRMGILPIALETGRFRNLAIADRLCVLCNLQAVEDELHFLCVCSLYNDIRRDMFENLLHLNFDNFNILSLHDKLYHLLKFEWKGISCYLDKAWVMRTNALYTG